MIGGVGCACYATRMADRARELKPGQKVHPRITRGQGTPLVLERPLGEECTVCGRGQMYVVDETEGADVSVHCDRCDNASTRKRSTIPRPLVPPGERPAAPHAAGAPPQIGRAHV